MDKREFACFKRCLEWYQVIPKYRREMNRSPQEAIRVLGFEGILDADRVQEAIHCIVGAIPAEKDGENPYLRAYQDFFKTVGAHVERRHDRSRFATTQLYRFADTTRNRCQMESAALRRHQNIRYFPICFELSSGCRVQCSFCGLAAKKYTGSFPYTAENRALWRSVLRICKSLLGDILDTAICYFATEPMDNPDYEKFMLDHREIAGNFSQITTALADQYPERMRSWMQVLGEERMRTEAPLRFSIRNIDQFRRIMRLYSPEELAYVEVLPNNPESVFCYSDSGRAAEADYGQGKKHCYSICCISGLRVNMAEKTIAFIEPEMPDEEFPLGIRQREIRSFDDAQGFAEAMADMVGKYAAGILPADRPLCLNKNISIEEKVGFVYFRGDDNYYCLACSQNLKRAMDGIRNGESFDTIAEHLLPDRAQVEKLYLDINNLFIRGYVRMK